MKNKNDFPKRIEFVFNYFKEHHLEYGVSKPTKEAFITFLGISRGKLQSWERAYWPKNEDLQCIAQKMRLSFAWLAFGTGDPFDVPAVPEVPTAAPEADAIPAPRKEIDPLQRMTQAIGIAEDAWSIADYLGLPVADVTLYLQQVITCRQARQHYRDAHPNAAEAVPPSLSLPRAWLEAARRRYGITPAWLDSGLGKSHEERVEEDTPELRTLRGMVALLKEHGGTNEQVRELILSYGKRGDAGAEREEDVTKEHPVQTAYL
ncbi:MAG: hypothetical protein KH745_02290 [Bilophila sp.]|nr:hypothetical protein [Bilophila sp.]